MKNISITELHDLLQDIDLIDIREIKEYATGFIPSAVNIPMKELTQNHSKYLVKGKMYYIVCRGGVRSVTLCNDLDKFDYDLINVEGGTAAYFEKYK